MADELFTPTECADGLIPKICGGKYAPHFPTEQEPVTFRTVLYADGHFIINESSRNIEANVAEHGEATNVYIPFDPFGETDVEKYIFAQNSQRPWHEQSTSVKSVEIGTAIKPTNTAYWFCNFRDCTLFDLQKLNTRAVTNMRQMFRICRAVTSLDLSNFNTGSVIDMSYMFDNCDSMTSLDVTSFDTSSVTDMKFMFNYCSALTSLDLDSFDTSSVTNMSYMFNDCEMLTSLDLSNFNTGAVTDMSFMFYDCYKLASLDISNFNTSAVKTMSYMFYNCVVLVSLDLSSFDTSLVTDMSHMFSYCRTLETIYASANFIVTQVTSSGSMFIMMSNRLVGGNGTVWSGSNPTNKTYARIDGGTANPGYFTAR